jgi:septum formation protein
MLNLNEQPLVLASRSPRRAEILKAVGWRFEVVAAGIDETRLPGEPALDYVRRLALTKAESVARKLVGRLVLGADTVVVVDDAILGQPRDQADARRMLRLLSGKWHEVLTGVALQRFGDDPVSLVDHQATRVLFAALTNEEIERYVESGEPMDKAGAYAIQGKAAPFIKEIAGDYFNIVGLPIRLVYELTMKFPAVVDQLKGNYL